MDISKKISEIQRQPEHIRLRYVWGSVAISMFFILAIWIFSIGSLFQGDKSIENNAAPGITEKLQELQQQAPSLKDFTEEKLTTGNEGVTATENQTNLKYSPVTNDSEIPQTDAYSDLPNTDTVQ